MSVSEYDIKGCHVVSEYWTQLQDYFSMPNHEVIPAISLLSVPFVNKVLLLIVLHVNDVRARKVMESLVAIAIQAYAELNRWLEVLPFVSQTYNGLEDCPPLIAKLW